MADKENNDSKKLEVAMYTGVISPEAKVLIEKVMGTFGVTLKDLLKNSEADDSDKKKEDGSE